MPLPSDPTLLHGGCEIIDFFRQNRRPLFYVSIAANTLLGVDEWIGNLRFINTVDSFHGRHPNIFTAITPTSEVPITIVEANNHLLSHPQVVEFVRGAGPDAGVLFLIFDQTTEQLAHAAGLNVAHPTAKVRQKLDSKITTTRLAAKAGIPSVPCVLAAVDSYTKLRELTGDLGPDLVVQLPYGDAGTTTFFISSEADYRQHAQKIEAQAEVKAMKRIRCRQTTIEGCVTRHGILAGPLLTELVGYPELTPLPGGWCGNEAIALGGSTLVSPDIRREAQRAVLALGEQLRQEGYWGCFGLDFLLDQDSGTLYLGEMNPRLTGVTPLTNQVMRDRQQPPLLLFHLLEWMGIDFCFDIEQFNRLWLETGPAQEWSQLIIEHVRDESVALTQIPPSGIWQMEPDGVPRFVRPAFKSDAATQPSEAFFISTVTAGHPLVNGSVIGRLTLRERVLESDNQLTARAAEWIGGFHTLFDNTAQGTPVRDSPGST